MDEGGANRRKAKKAADFARRERYRAAAAELEAERARRREENRSARERGTAARAERQRAAEEESRRQRELSEHTPLADDGATKETQRRRRDTPRPLDPEREAERERKRLAAAERRAAREARERRKAERRAERQRAEEAARRAEREAVRDRALAADPYALLGVLPEATAEEIARAYRQLARTLHPDLNRQGTADERAEREARMKRVNVAYNILSDPQRRKAHDRQRRRF
jgi:hypothetical protein